MGKLNIFEITFSNFQGVYYPGQNLEGHVTVELSQGMSMRGIRLRFEGKAYVEWSEGSGENRTTYYASEEYFKQDVLLFGIWPGQGSDTTQLPAGRHAFPFCFELPSGLPSSFEGDHGYVRYSVKGIIDKPWKFDHTTERRFTVIAILDLNADPDAQAPVQSQDDKMLCCLCCASGPITADFRLERRGFVPGEAIRLYANIHNHSSRRMDKSYVDLRMITVFRSQSESCTTTKEVARVTEGPIEAGGSFSWEGHQQLVIPPLPPSYLAGCSIIDIRYILQLNVDPSGPSLDLEVPLEVIIGTVPLRQVVEQHPPHMPPPLSPPQAGHPPQDGASAPPVEPHMPAALRSSVPNLPPPAYRESVFGKVNVKSDADKEYTHSNPDYTPVYTYYDWGNQPTTTQDVDKH